jgi:hypothetical protein
LLRGIRRSSQGHYRLSALGELPDDPWPLKLQSMPKLVFELRMALCSHWDFLHWLKPLRNRQLPVDMAALRIRGLLLHTVPRIAHARERSAVSLVPDETDFCHGGHNNENGTDVSTLDVAVCYRLFQGYAAGLDCQRARSYGQPMRDRCPRQDLKIRDLIQLPRPQRDSKTVHCCRRAKAERALRRRSYRGGCSCQGMDGPRRFKNGRSKPGDLVAGKTRKA